MARSTSTDWPEPKGAPRAATLDPLIVWKRAGDFPGSVVSGAGAEPTRPGAPVRCLWCRGRIANRDALITRLEAPPDVADDNLVARLFARFGAEAVSYVEGAVSWVVWDATSGRLVAARDRLGLRGLYFVESARAVALSDRVAPLLSWLTAPRRWRTKALVAQIHGLAPAAGETFYRGVEAVRPGELLSIESAVERRIYWQVEPGPELRLGSDAEYGAALRHLLVETTRGYAAGRVSA